MRRHKALSRPSGRSGAVVNEFKTVGRYKRVTHLTAGGWFPLTEHPLHDPDPEEDRQFLVTRLTFAARECAHMSYFAWNRYDTRALAEALAAALSPTWEAAQWYALVDTAFDAGRKIPFAFPPDSRAVYQGGPLDGLNAVSPLLVPLNGDPTLPESLALRLLHHCNGRPMLSFLRSSLTTDAICAVWQNVIEVETSDGEVFALRFADTRVTPVLASQTLASLWARLSAAVNEWHTIDRGGTLSLLQAVRGSVGGNEESRFRLDDAMLSRLLQSGEVDALATRLHAQMPAAAAQPSRCAGSRDTRIGCRHGHKIWHDSAERSPHAGRCLSEPKGTPRECRFQYLACPAPLDDRRFCRCIV
jgi:hypothetical protein